MAATTAASSKSRTATAIAAATMSSSRKEIVFSCCERHGVVCAPRDRVGRIFVTSGPTVTCTLCPPEGFKNLSLALGLATNLPKNLSLSLGPRSS